MAETQTKAPEAKPPEKKIKSLWTDEEKDKRRALYGCDILVENGSLEEVNTRNAPSDALIVKYVHDDSIRYDFLKKLDMIGMNLNKLSKITSKQFIDDANKSGGTVNPHEVNFTPSPSNQSIFSFNPVTNPADDYDDESSGI